jgi:ribosomal protein S18 acetylase RimI-like enzyme
MMADMLVRLYALPPITPIMDQLKPAGIILRRAFPSEADSITAWVRKNFNETWAAECGVAMVNRPVTCFIAVEPQPVPEPNNDPYNLPPEKLVGFACYNGTSLGMFGPEGVHPSYRGKGIGKGLLLACMHAMMDAGYAYAVICWAGPVDFYKKTVGATLIEDSEPGIIRGPLVIE